MPRKAAPKKSNSNYLGAEELLSEINKKYGPNTMVRASDALALKRIYISTGSIGLDILLGGGLLEGKIHQFRGAFSSSKTWTLYTTAISYLTKYPEACFILIDPENAADEKHMESLGFTESMLDRTFIVRPANGERAADVAIDVAEKAKKVLIGLDSVDGMTPTAEAEEGMDKASMALGARMMNKFMRKLVPVMATDLLSDDPRTTFIMISQIRTKFNVMFGSPDTTWGGMGKEFAATTIIKFARTSWLKEGDKTNGKTYGVQIMAEIIKCKGPGHGESVEYDFYKMNYKDFNIGEYDNVKALVDWGIRVEVINKSAKSYTYRKISEVGLPAFIAKLNKMPNTQQKLLDDIINARRKMYAPKHNG